VEVRSVLGALSAAFRFAGSLELAAELDPEILTKEWVTTACVNGLSRASLGVQNLDREVQAAVNRPESFDHIADCVRWLRDGGVSSINMDLMYGLPRQTVANTLATVDQLMTLRPERISLFGYAHVPWMKSHQKLIDENALPGASERLDQFDAAARRLASEGYVRIGMDHFASLRTTSARPRPRAGCAATSRATRRIRRRSCWAWGRPPSAACRRASCRTPRRRSPGARPWTRRACPWRGACG
jgi:oxygen-independent coproporphyrinogen-3 oxidase